MSDNLMSDKLLTLHPSFAVQVLFLISIVLTQTHNLHDATVMSSTSLDFETV